MFVGMKLLDVYDPESFGKFALNEHETDQCSASTYSENTECQPFYHPYLNPSLLYIRPRRKYDQVQRRFSCPYPNCKKSYGSISHLNTHIRQKGHGKPLRTSDFKF